MVVGCLGTVLALAAGGCSSSASDGSASTTATASAAKGAAADVVASVAPPPQVPLLGVLNATGGTYEDGTLELTGVGPSGVWFTDRPVRQAGTSPNEAFVDLFFAGDDPPNAAIEIAGAEESGDVAIVELSDPKVHVEMGTVTFTAKPIGDVGADVVAAHPGLASYASRDDGTLPASFGASAVFLDAAVSPVTPDELTTLAAELAATITDNERIVNLVQAAVLQEPHPCQIAVLTDAQQNVHVLTTESTPQVQQMQRDAAANGGQLPDADDQQFATTQAEVQAAAADFDQWYEDLDALLDGSC